MTFCDETPKTSMLTAKCGECKRKFNNVVNIVKKMIKK
jgi:hypothetical protein